MANGSRLIHARTVASGVMDKIRLMSGAGDEETATLAECVNATP